jgi:hypothetical protein
MKQENQMKEEEKLVKIKNCKKDWILVLIYVMK